VVLLSQRTFIQLLPADACNGSLIVKSLSEPYPLQRVISVSQIPSWAVVLSLLIYSLRVPNMKVHPTCMNQTQSIRRETKRLFGIVRVSSTRKFKSAVCGAVPPMNIATSHHELSPGITPRTIPPLCLTFVSES
jgi:hypothetical protein